MAEIDSELLRQSDVTTPQDNKVKHLITNSGLRGISRIVFNTDTPKTQTQGEFLFDVDSITGEKRIITNDQNDFVLTINNTKALTTKDHALLDSINAQFTQGIDFDNIRPEDLRLDVLTVNLNVLDYMRLCGKDEEYISNADNVKKFKKRHLAPSTEHLLDVKMSWKSSEGDFDGIHPFSRLRVVGKNIMAELGATFAKELINRRDSKKMLFDTNLIKIAYNDQGKSRAKQLAYILAKKLFEQASINNNVKNSEKGYFSLSVKKAVEAVKFALREDIKSPVKDIINPMFEALEILTEEGIIDYCFSGKNKQRLNEMETQKVLSDYETFINAYICFKIINFNTEEKKEVLLKRKQNRADRRRRGRPRINHNKVYENPKG